MARSNRRRRWTTAWAASLAVALAPLSATTAAATPTTQTHHSGVVSWIRRHAHRVNALPSGHAPPSRLSPLRRVAHDAAVVSLGASTEGAQEFAGATQGLTRYLITHMGFRTIAIEDDWTAGVLLNRYVLQGRGDLRDVVPQLAPRFRTHRMMRFVRWVRHYNLTHRHDVRFFGTDATTTRRLAYDIVTDYVAAAAPARSAQLRRYFATIRPDTDDIWAYNAHFYQEVRDKQRYVELAERTYRLVAELPSHHDDPAYQTALHSARTIKAYYTIAALRPTGYRDALMAHNIRWFRHRRHARTVYISASAHTAVDPDLTVSYPPRPTWTTTTAGTYLRRAYGSRYVSIGLTFGHGSVTTGFAEGDPRSFRVPPPDPGSAEDMLSRVHARCYLLVLDQPAPSRVADWLHSPSRLRVISAGSFDPSRAADYAISDGSLRQWFDALVHVRRISAAPLMG